MKTIYLFLTLFTSIIPMTSHTHPKKPRIAVIGAGLAGLTTAYRLAQQGLDVHVYEAKDRVGGRILSAYLNDNVVELGGQNILDGGEAHHTVQLIQEMGLELEDYSRNFDFYYLDNDNLVYLHEIIRQKRWKAEDIYNQLLELKKTCHTMQEVITKLLADENDPLAQRCKVLLAAYEGGTPDKLSVKYIETLYHILLGGLSSTHQISDKKTLSYLIVKGGNSLLPQALAHKLGDKVHLNMPLKALTKNKSGSYLLTFDNHASDIEADIVVLALPCGVYHTINFNNVIPDTRLQQLYKVGFGTTAKTIVPSYSNDYLVKTCADNRVIVSYHKEMKSFIVYHTGQAGSFTPATLPNLYQTNLKLIHKGWNPEFISQETAVYAHDKPFVRYIHPVAYSWVQDPYIQGSYSYIAAGQEEVALQLEKYAGHHVRTLFAPVDGTLYFAGEHTTIMMDILGTIEAACESGDRTAAMITSTLED